MHRRMLYRAFNQVTGKPPIEFFRFKRLDAVRAALKKKRRDKSVLIKDIARKHGFRELSRFAGQYQPEFGELPSDLASIISKG